MHRSNSALVLAAAAGLAACARQPARTQDSTPRADAVAADARSAAASPYDAWRLACGVQPLGDPQRPARLLDGLGDLTYPVTTSSPRAQQFFDQGLRLVYAFNHEEARLSFLEAGRLDPACAMAWWGVALTLGTNYNLPTSPERARVAYQSVQRARSLAAGAAPRERALIDALSRRYAQNPPADDAGKKALERAYADAMRDVFRSFPDDTDIATLFAESMMNLRPWDLWTKDGLPQPGTEEIVATLESVLASRPDHPGANHYYIHAVEASRAPERALPAADRLGALMPGAGHLVHMPGHVYIRVGRYDAAAEANRRAIRADEDYLAAIGPSGFYSMMYVNHNYHFLGFAATAAGRSAEALRVADAMHDRLDLDLLAQAQGMTGFAAWRVLTLARFARWDDILRSPLPGDNLPFPRALHHYARGLALVGTGRADEAVSELESIRSMASRVPESAYEGFSPARIPLQIADKVLSARIAAALGDATTAVRLLEEGVALEDSLNYGEPPDWYAPVRDALGAQLLAMGRPGDAEAVYRENLRRNPGAGWSLFGLEQSLRAQGKSAEAERVNHEFQQAWKDADVTVTASWL